MKEPPVGQSRRRLPLLLIALCLGAFSFAVYRNPKEPQPGALGRPNVLLVVLDTTRAESFSSYGNPRRTTPNFDRLAATGVRFERAYTTDFWTLPAHGSLFTGMYPSETQATAETNQLPDNVVTLAERLHDSGYDTGAVVCNSWISRERGFAQGFTDYTEMWRKESHPPNIRSGWQVEQAAIDRAIAWIDEKSQTPSPFFLFVNSNIAHMPYKPPPKMRERFLKQSWPKEKVERVKQIAGMWRHLAGRLRLDEDDFAIMRELYEAEVAVADDFVGQLAEALEQRGILDDTLLIVTSDHGENIGDHGMIDHLLSMYESTLRIPLLMRFPDRFPSGMARDDLVSLVDVMPTVLDVCGLLDDAAPGGAERTSLCREDRFHRAFVIAENERPVNGVELLNRMFPTFDTSAIDRPMRMIRTHRYKLIWHEDARVELYDLLADPAEERDLAEKETKVRDELLAQLKNWKAAIESGAAPDMLESRDIESLELLRSLGYID